MEIFKKNKEIIFIIILSSGIILVAGLTSEVYLGDEVYHYRFAKDIFKAGKRVTFDSLYSSGTPPGYFYNSEPFWHFILAFLWKLTGGISFITAQVYHTFYYIFLIIFTYLIGAQLYGKEEGILASLLISSTPMVIAFSILFYLDIPSITFATLSFLLLIKKRYFLTGIVISIVYFTKRNACFFIPSFILFIIFFEKFNLWAKLKNIFFVIFPVLILSLFDYRWRIINIESIKYNVPGIGEFSSIETINHLKTRLIKFIWGTGEYLNSSLINPKDFIKYFGGCLIVSLILYFLIRKRDKRDWVLWIFIMNYFLFFIFFFGINSDIRYLLPIIPFICILTSTSFTFLKNFTHKKLIRNLIWILCFFQIFGTSLYVHKERQIPVEIEQGFEFIKKNTPPDALFMFPGYIFIESTERKFIWSSFFLIESQKGIKHMFWNENEEEIKEIIKMIGLNYIVVNKKRIYDDSKLKHFGGYPRSFIERLSNFPFIYKIFENSEISIWKIKND